MIRIGEQTLMRYADGELGAVRAGEVERALAEDPELRARLERDRRLRTLLADHYDAVESEPVPPRLASAIAKPVMTPPGRAPGWWKVAAALAALLLLGWIVGALL